MLQSNPASWLNTLVFTRAPASVVLIRLYVGLVFACEGVLKFMRVTSLGTGRFYKAGIPAPAFFSTLDGVFEIGCGVLILVGLLTRLAAVPMIIDMLGALLITKLPIFWGRAAVSRRTRLVGLHPRSPCRPGPAMRQPLSASGRGRRLLTGCVPNA